MILDLITVGLLGLIIALILRSEGKPVKTRQLKHRYLVDTSALVDGRIFRIENLEFGSEGQWVVPASVMAELKQLADNKAKKYAAQRARATIALEKLSNMQCVDNTLVSDKDADVHLLEIALLHGDSIVTLDKNLIRQARAQGVRVFNPDELRRQVEPLVQVGDTLKVALFAKSRAKNSAHGTTEWGELVVVENGAKYSHKTITAEVVAISGEAKRRLIILRH